ncbi:MAG: ABC transporter permease [Candidatus Eisenbacteria bacterium]|uniref:Transport permease protein n=1 Tax=Eiseniibacteriota bacterium TaxID=2212470 RepID=A0A849SQN7_UNCEI|nr:ABC transporter permease [Candidatus Eisenbacteria bacterium]
MKAPSDSHAAGADPFARPHVHPAVAFYRAARARLYVRMVGSFREPTWIIGDSLFPAFGMAAFVLLYRALGAPAAYETLAVLGGILSAYWLNVLWGMGTQLYWEKQQGQLQLYFVAPVSRMAILTGMAVGGVLTTTIRTVVGLIVGFGILGARVPAFDPWMLAFVFVLSMVALYALGMTLSSLFLLFGREAWHLANALAEPVYFMSGLYFPLRTLGGFGLVAACVVPLGFGVDALRQVLLGEAARGLLPLDTEIVILAVLSVGFLILARFSLAQLERISKNEGRLTQRWQ